MCAERISRYERICAALRMGRSIVKQLVIETLGIEPAPTTWTDRLRSQTFSPQTIGQSAHRHFSAYEQLSAPQPAFLSTKTGVWKEATDCYTTCSLLQRAGSILSEAPHAIDPPTSRLRQMALALLSVSEETTRAANEECPGARFSFIDDCEYFLEDPYAYLDEALAARATRRDLAAAAELAADTFNLAALDFDIS